MLKTDPADFIGKTNLGYALLAFLSDNARNQVAALLQELSAALPGVLWTMPPEQLHITLCEIVQPKEYSRDKDSLFASFQKKYQNTLVQILSDTPKLTVTFDTIEARPQAIIIKATNSSSLNSIRAKLTARMRLPDETRTPPDITHSSIARYLKEMDLEKVQGVVAAHTMNLREEITEFKLIRNEVLPLQKYEVLGTYLLPPSQQAA